MLQMRTWLDKVQLDPAMGGTWAGRSTLPLHIASRSDR